MSSGHCRLFINVSLFFEARILLLTTSQVTTPVERCGRKIGWLLYAEFLLRGLFALYHDWNVQYLRQHQKVCNDCGSLCLLLHWEYHRASSLPDVSKHSHAVLEQFLTTTRNEAPRFINGFIGTMVCLAIACATALLLRVLLSRENKKRDNLYGQPGAEHGLEDLTDKENKDFRYHL